MTPGPGHAGDARAGRLRRALVISGIWGAVALFFAGQNVLRHLVRNQPILWVDAVLLEMLYWLPWVLLTPLLLHAARRWRLESDVWRRHVWTHLALAVLVSFVQVAAAFVFQYSALWLILGPPAQVAGASPATPAVASAEWGRFFALWRVGPPIFLLTAFWKYWVFVAIYYAFDYYRKYRDRELRTLVLEARLANAELQALKSQLHPHFLFNTLHSVSMLNLTDVDAANRILVSLSHLLRLSLDHDRAQEVTLERELDVVDRYLEIERIRFGDRLHVVYDVESATEEALVPGFLLQPLVENAIRHGVGRRSRAGRLDIRARRRDGRLLLEVVDDGPGLPPDWSPGGAAGLGLSNVLARLEALYGRDHTIEFLTPGAEGTAVRITIPLRWPAHDEDRPQVGAKVRGG